MNEASWLIQVYEMADPQAQQSTVTFLSGMPGLTVDARSCDRRSYVIVECADASEGLAVFELVMMADVHAELIYSTISSAQAEAVRRRVRSESEYPDLKVGSECDMSRTKFPSWAGREPLAVDGYE